MYKSLLLTNCGLASITALASAGQCSGISPEEGANVVQESLHPKAGEI